MSYGIKTNEEILTRKATPEQLQAIREQMLKEERHVAVAKIFLIIGIVSALAGVGIMVWSFLGF